MGGRLRGDSQARRGHLCVREQSLRGTRPGDTGAVCRIVWRENRAIDWRLTWWATHGRFLNDGYCPIFDVAIPHDSVLLYVLLREWAGGCEPVNQSVSARNFPMPTI